MHALRLDIGRTLLLSVYCVPSVSLLARRQRPESRTCVLCVHMRLATRERLDLAPYNK